MERYIQQQGKQVTYYDDGSTGRPLLLLPSLGGTYQDWSDILTKLTPGLPGRQLPSARMVGRLYERDDRHLTANRTVT
ncbi:hypothetical protein OVA29_10420 [Exiguobacterium sp. SL14]|nr:hypothetical protein [Exiguobacterium sp. SL14]MCY1691035.1 hypothetical protein [Exiguobacterium sp. SL14]